ncbi:MAG: helix-turn-helix domain-containing protein [Bacteroidota bacterium]
MHRPDHHNEIELNLLRSGSLTYLLRGRRVTIQPGRLVAFWALVPHQIVEFEGDSPYYVATIPLSSFLQWNLPGGFANRILGGEVIQAPESTGESYDFGLFERWLHDVEADMPERLDIVLLELEARMRRLALSCAAEPGLTPEHLRLPLDAHHSSKVERMAGYVATHYRQPIQVKDIGKAVGLHPDYATALFRKTFGMTLSEYLLDHRISHAQRMLTATHTQITTIAYEAGFNSISRFNAAFKKACGVTPRQYRKQHQLN